jgi:lipopolysaccharide export system protein LptA
MPAQSMGPSYFLSQSSSNSASSLPPTNHFVEILCANYELRTNLAVFRDQVKVTDRLGDELRGEMSCGLMTLTFTGTNELQKMVAEHQVVIAQEDKQFTAETAEYTGADGLLNLDGHPAWRAGTREGKGDRMRLNLAHEEMLVRGNAYMRLPAAELGQSAFAALGTNQPVKAKVTTNEFAEIFSTEYLLTPAAALFRDRVRIEHPQIKETCDELTLLSPPELGNAGRMVIAEPAVVFDVVDDEGRNFHGTGDKAVYTHRATTTLTNDMMELTGHPAVLEATNVVGRNNIITLDLTSHKLMAPGKYNIVGVMPAAAVKALGQRQGR